MLLTLVCPKGAWTRVTVGDSGRVQETGNRTARLPDVSVLQVGERKIQKIKEGPKFIPWRWKSRIIVSQK